jgi:hypothetical protein
MLTKRAGQFHIQYMKRFIFSAGAAEPARIGAVATASAKRALFFTPGAAR